jgi:hypothetical protein
MNILLLTSPSRPHTSPLCDFLAVQGSLKIETRKPRLWAPEAPQWDLIVSDGYKWIIPPDMLRAARRPPVNIHLGNPQNRGVYPNFFCWLEDRAPGFMVHEMTNTIDSGRLYVAGWVKWDPDFLKDATLRTTWTRLYRYALKCFCREWDHIERQVPLSNRILPVYEKPHTVKEFKRWFPRCSKGWNTPVEEVRCLKIT